jgi:hypothetical protein
VDSTNLVLPPSSRAVQVHFFRRKSRLEGTDTGPLLLVPAGTLRDVFAQAAQKSLAMPVQQFRLGRVHGLFVLLDPAQLECARHARRGRLLMQSAGASSGRLVTQHMGGRAIAIDEDPLVPQAHHRLFGEAHDGDILDQLER